MSKYTKELKLAVVILKSQGWRVLIIWECELKNCDVVESRIKQLLLTPHFNLDGIDFREMAVAICLVLPLIITIGRF